MEIKTRLSVQGNKHKWSRIRTANQKDIDVNALQEAEANLLVLVRSLHGDVSGLTKTSKVIFYKK